MILQFQQRFQCPAIVLESKAAHQVGRFTGILCGQQRVDQALPHISGSVIIDLTGPEHPCEIYYHAPADVRDGLIHALLSAEYSSEASNLMSCLAMQGDDKAMQTLLELERNPRPWRKGLYVDPSSYAQIGGWTFDKEGQKIQLNFDTCYPMVKGTTGEKSPVRIGRSR